MERCIDCGASLALVGRRHNCRPRPQPIADEPQATPFISMDEAGAVEIHPNDDEPKLPPKSQQRRHAARVKAEPKRADKVESEVGNAPDLTAKVKKLTAAAFEAAKTKFTIRLDPAVVKQIKVTSAEREITMERFVELAIKEKLEGSL